MRRLYVVGFLSLLCFDVLAQISFKYTATHALPVTGDVDWLIRIFSQPWVYTALLGYAGAFFTWLTLLKHAPIGPAFAASHLEVVVVIPLAMVLFDEQVGWPQVIGAAAILGGIVCLAFSEDKEGARAP